MAVIGFAPNDPVPVNAVQVSLAQGDVTGGSTEYPVILLGNKLSTGAGENNVKYGPDTPVQMQTEQDVINLFGAGSELHRGWRRYAAVNKVTSVYAMAVEEPVGAQADGYIGLVDSDQLANSAGTIRVVINDTRVSVGFASGTHLSDIADELVDAINSRTELPVTATVNGFGVNLTAKQLGVKGNEIRYHAEVSPVVGTGITVTPTSRTLMANGSGDDDISDALAALGEDRMYHIVCASNDSTNLGLLSSLLDTNQAALVGVRNRAYAGFIGSLSNANALAIGLNSVRFRLVLMTNHDWTSFEIACQLAAVEALFESDLTSRYGLNMSGFGSDAVTSQFWRMRAPLDGSRPSRSELKSALMNGVTPIAVAPAGGGTYLVRRITTRSFGSGGTPDYRARDAHKLTVMDRFGDDLVARANATLGGRTVSADPLPGQSLPSPLMVTPLIFRSLIISQVDLYNQLGLLQNVDEIKAGIVVKQNPENPQRLDAIVPLQVVDILAQTASELNEVSIG